MEILAKVLVEDHELADAESREQERNGQSSGIDGKEQDAARNGVAASGKYEHCAENRADTRSPTKSECEPEQETAPDSGLRRFGAKVNVAIEPTGH